MEVAATARGFGNEVPILERDDGAARRCARRRDGRGVPLAAPRARRRPAHVGRGRADRRIRPRRGRRRRRRDGARRSRARRRRRRTRHRARRGGGPRHPATASSPMRRCAPARPTCTRRATSPTRSIRCSQRHLRSEHWANALHAGKVAARSMLGRPACFDDIPYFYTDQFDLGMELSGYAPLMTDAELVVRGDLDAREFIAFWVDDGRVVAGMNVNVWDVNETVQALIRSGERIDTERLRNATCRWIACCRDARSRYDARAARGDARPSRRASRPLAACRGHGDREPHARLVLRPRRDLRARRGGGGGRRRRRGGRRHRRRRRREVRARTRRCRSRTRSHASCRWCASSHRSTRVSVDTFQPEVAARRSRRAPRSSTTPPGCTTRRWPTSSRRATPPWSSPTASPRLGRSIRSPRYADVVGDVAEFLAAPARARASRTACPTTRIVLDPGHDLNKNTRHTLELTRRLGELAPLGRAAAGRAVEQGLRRRDARPRRATTACRDRSPPRCSACSRAPASCGRTTCARPSTRCAWSRRSSAGGSRLLELHNARAGGNV